MEDSLKKMPSVLFSRFLSLLTDLGDFQNLAIMQEKAQGGVGEEIEDLMVLFTGLYLLPKTGWEEYLLQIPFSLFYLEITQCWVSPLPQQVT